ncbi:hypothetical protein DYB37_011385 [Aphanomyces astaci]|uniref:Uncharacterized protein n=2 Tax=Aphanomyces astaci TaxID=112090 RepID=A0A397DQR2_APHAT|nr:hypothetical protein DYB38_009351 [Aphanomyces astaci]RHZ30825.1 hypothetical protein DYB37_011385 [Aphanomyces astaci]
MCLRPNAFCPTADPLEDQSGVRHRSHVHGQTPLGDDIEHELMLDFLNHLDSPSRTQTNVNFETQNGMTPLIMACVLNLHVDRLLAEPSLDLNYKNAFSYSALMAACEANQVEVVKTLLTQPTIDRSDINAGFCLACKGGYAELVAFLLTCHADLDLSFGMAMEDELEGFSEACLHGHLDVVRYLVESTDVDVNYGVHDDIDMFPHGVSSFYLACQSDHAEVVRFLLSLPQLDPRQLCNVLLASL